MRVTMVIQTSAVLLESIKYLYILPQFVTLNFRFALMYKLLLTSVLLRYNNRNPRYFGSSLVRILKHCIKVE